MNRSTNFFALALITLTFASASASEQTSTEIGSAFLTLKAKVMALFAPATPEVAESAPVVVEATPASVEVVPALVEVAPAAPSVIVTPSIMSKVTTFVKNTPSNVATSSKNALASLKASGKAFATSTSDVVTKGFDATKLYITTNPLKTSAAAVTAVAIVGSVVAWKLYKNKTKNAKRA